MKRISLLLGALAASAAVAGCGAANDINPDVVAQAADKTAEAGGAHMTMIEQVAGRTLRGDGFTDNKGRKARLTLQLPNGQGKFETVYVDRQIYMQFPPSVQKKVGKPWVRIDLEKATKAQGIDLGALQSTTSSDPSGQLDQLRGAGDVTKVGSEQVRGTDTTHYKATIDLRKSVERAPAAQREAARRSVENIIKDTGQSSVPMEVWLDKAGRARRLKFTQKIQGKSVTLTMELYDFGTKEALKAPPASETKDITDEAVKQAKAGG
jgi:hypothetical protein